MVIGQLMAGIKDDTQTNPYARELLSSTEFVARFVLNYAKQNALLLPGQTLGYSRFNIKLLPSSVSKHGIWKVYQAAVMSDSMRGVGYSTFNGLWRSHRPSIQITLHPEKITPGV